ncbi:MAG: HAMP domain-containing sensor histidine kinase [Bacteroidetes bacterium]|nr:HAMP domain-containing sensor histidine kinase [Bacteroidota bacterium]
MIFNEKISRKKIAGYFLTGLLLIFLGVALGEFFSFRDRPENITRNFEEILHAKEKLLLAAIEKIKTSRFDYQKYNSAGPAQELQDFYKKRGIVLFIYENDSLVFWTVNAVPVPEKISAGLDKIGRWCENQRNGWFEVIRIRDSSKVYTGQILLKHQYLFENEYLRNSFGPEFKVTEKTEISLQYGRNNVRTSDGRFLCSLKIPASPAFSQLRIILLFLLYFAGFILVLVSVYKLYCRLEALFSSRWLFLLSFALDVLILRILQFYFRVPFVLYDSDLFGPASFSSSVLLPSLGDFLVNSILLLLISYVFFHHYPGFSGLKKLSKPFRSAVSLLLLILVVAGFYSIVAIIRDLVVNSTIPFNLQDISGLNFSSFLGCIIISAVFLSYFLIVIRLLRSILDLVGIREIKIFRKHKISDTSMTRILLWLILFSFTGTLILNHFNNSIEKEKRKLLAIKLGAARDPMAELLFSKVEPQIIRDSLFRKACRTALQKNSEEYEDSIEKYLQETYFRGYWNNYTFQVTMCTAAKTLRVQPHNYLINCRSYFQNIISDFGKATLSRNLYFLDYGYGYKNYLAVIPLSNDVNEKAKDEGNAYVEISSKLIFKDLGYPELLIDKNQGQIPDISGYSYAYYRSGKLIHRVGNLQYSLELDHEMGNNHTHAHNYSKDGFDHYCYPVDKSNVLIVSKKESTLLDEFAPFSYLFFIFTLFSMLFFAIIRFGEVVSISFLRLGDRLQLSMAGILAASLLITGVLIIYYIISLNTSKNQENLNERTHSLLVELQHKIGNSVDFSGLSENELNEILTEFSNVFFADVNLYNPDGRLMATSRPEIFEEGLTSVLMNRKAFEQLRFRHNSYYIQQERIGEHGYYSAYMPFFDERNNLLAYLNLPYFARQEDLKKEISTFLVAFINVYVFLIIIGIFIALVVSNYISRPLRILTSRIGQLSYGKYNEKIEWKRKDEIGRLVDEYNRMIDELARSAELLARSERESAWREMARQVAHEIKNPLTPMKLSVQHLEKTWKDNSPDWEDRLVRFTASMTEQIESLSAIASEFSDFAKMPVTQPEILNINEILENVKALYQDTTQINFEFRNNPAVPARIMGDRKQLLRVFTNLINNAIQAIGNNEDGRVIIELECVEKRILIKISDNGIGIPGELTDRIFQPNFTTKSGGMGMGLAIVKSIIQGLSGEISFVSGEGSGTTFTIVFTVSETDV